MGADTKIEWCDHTFNPWYGCTKVSPGCEHCYAEGWAKRSGLVRWGPFANRRRSREENWRKVIRWNADAALCRIIGGEIWLGKPGADRVIAYPFDGVKSDITRQGQFPLDGWESATRWRPRVFCASLADWLDDAVPIEWLRDLLNLIRLTPNLDWLLLSKRPQNWKRRINEAFIYKYLHGTGPSDPVFLTSLMADEWQDGNPPANVWIGTTVEDQKRADERIPLLLSIPARVRFLSCEPLLESVDLGLIGTCPREWCKGYSPVGSHIHWVIAGGESGPKSRPMHPDWARSLRDQCQASGVPFLFKQWGESVPDRDRAKRCDINLAFWMLADGSTGKGQPQPEGCEWMARVGKHDAGRLLDGVEHNASPQIGGAA